MEQSKNIFNNFFWRFLERCGAQGVTLVVSIILSRLLDPSVYGVIALVTVFTAVLGVFIDSGMGSALIQKKDADDLDFSSVFFFNITSAVVLYCVMFFAAPLIARFYELPELTAVIRVMCLSFLIGGVKSVQQSYVSRTLQFKRFFFATLGGTVGAAVIGIWMAYAGYGVWAIVVQNLFNQTVDTIILWITVRWRPKRMFSFRRLKPLFSYGWKLLVSALVDTVYSRLWQLIIGKVYTTSDLAFYNKGDTLPYTFIANINTSIDSVLLPTMSAEQNDRSRVREMTRRAITTSIYCMAPIMMGLAICAEPIVRIVFTEKWLPCVPFLRIFCFTYTFYPIHTANLNAIKALGHSDYFLRLEIIKKCIGLTALLLTMRHGVLVMAYSQIITSVICQVLNSWPNKKLLDYSYPQQLRDILPSLLTAAVMGAAVYLVRFLSLGDWPTLLIQVPLGVLLYLGGSALFRIEPFRFLCTVARSYLSDRRSKGETA